MLNEQNIDGRPWRRELILGGQKSGKSRRAEMQAKAWLAGGGKGTPRREAQLIATGQAWDEEMRARIKRHQVDRARRVPGMGTLEEPRDLAGLLAQNSAPHRLLVIDCLTLWLTNWLMPADDLASKSTLAQDWQAQCALFMEALEQAPGPVILVGNEIGLGVIPLGSEVRAFVDALGQLNQQVARRCESVTLMCAGLALGLK
ncbi:bifunctional adenosylcobinamide kinase/adenosylcobinamide-phosphate guanylyltransferase [Comamonas composti]|uniref:bifunctional adenosylcobinamide kinase/adenosylcobinamide-phosphate guanylyltransferase n=1 Tax=Comamonas composti TaxID=408558 RepID=UPI00041F7942|nr:bifunctional adenosylcobinamide kinase/adenosylcobinamide-phosphate guanylyltransferase [Comamonas composti]